MQQQWQDQTNSFFSLKSESRSSQLFGFDGARASPGRFKISDAKSGVGCQLG